jgi:hypothetical protein
MVCIFDLASVLTSGSTAEPDLQKDYSMRCCRVEVRNPTYTKNKPGLHPQTWF